MDANFGPTVRSAVHYHNVNHQSLAKEERIQKLMAKVENMQTIVGKSVKLLLERERKMDRLIERTDELTEDAKVFEKKSVRLKRQHQQRYFAKYAVWGLTLMVLTTGAISIMLLSVCGVGLKRCRWLAAERDFSNRVNNKDDDKNEGKLRQLFPRPQRLHAYAPHVHRNPFNMN